MNTFPNGQTPSGRSPQESTPKRPPDGELPKKRRAVRRVPTEQTAEAQPRPRAAQAPTASEAQPRPRAAQAPTASEAQPRPRAAQAPTASEAQSRPRAAQAPTASEAQPPNGQASSLRGIEYVNVKRPTSASSLPAHPAKPLEQSAPVVAKAPAKSKKKKSKVRYVGGSALGSLLKAVIYIMAVMVVSGFLSYYIIVIANDVFAFVKPTEEIAVQIEANATIDDIAEELYEEGVIEYPKIFALYTRIRRDLEGIEFVEGEHMVSSSMNYDYLYKTFLPVTVRSIERITIPEGYTIDEIIDLFLSYGMGSREGFVDAIQNADFSDYWFIAELDGNLSPDRRYRLEGYLFPDTYEFYTDLSETQILRKLLDNFEAKFDIAYKERCDQLGMSVDDIVILASMIQMEAKYAEEYGAISSVFHNRLNSAAFMKRLDSDATIQYALGVDRKSELTGEDTKLDSPYNTYRNSGLPPGPISNPSLNAISYALYPDKTEYYYFVAKPNGYSLFATTEAQHLENIRIARSQ